MGDVLRDGKGIEVVFVGPKTFPPTIGGIETHVYELSKRVAAKGFSVTVIVPESTNLPREENFDGVRVVRVACLKGRYSLKLTAMPGIMRELRRRKGAVVHAHDATGGYASALCAQRGRLAYTMHGIGFHEKDWPTPFRQGIKMMQRTALRRASKIFCTDQRTLEAIRASGRDAELLASGVDVADYDKGRSDRPEDYDPGKFIVLFVGRLTRVKGVEVLLETIRRMDPNKRQEAQFVLIGDGPLDGKVKTAASEMPQIRLLGPIEHSRIKPYFAHADAFVLPSLSEGMPMALLEAMASGLPCVASRVGGVESGMSAEVLKLVTPGDPEELLEALVNTIDDRATGRALGDRGRSHVAKNYSWDPIIDRLVATYEELSLA